jgi:DNA-binding MarR family transcriptional regulator
MSGVIDRLCKKGLISRNISPTDRRARVIALTEAGHNLLAQAGPQVAALQADILAPLSQDEQAHLLRLLEKITGADPSA